LRRVSKRADKNVNTLEGIETARNVGRVGENRKFSGRTRRGENENGEGKRKFKKNVEKRDSTIRAK